LDSTSSSVQNKLSPTLPKRPQHRRLKFIFLPTIAF
jgi:hypothetical protein